MSGGGVVRKGASFFVGCVTFFDFLGVKQVAGVRAFDSGGGGSTFSFRFHGP